nr:unnamed protein product [Callosobruchus analis]
MVLSPGIGTDYRIRRFFKELLTKKLITPFALITAHRAQTFALIDIRNIHQTKSRYDILITDKIKTSGINKQQPCLAIPYFENDRSIPSATTLESYLKATSQFRETKFRLFLTYKNLSKKHLPSPLVGGSKPPCQKVVLIPLYFVHISLYMLLRLRQDGMELV